MTALRYVCSNLTEAHWNINANYNPTLYHREKRKETGKGTETPTSYNTLGFKKTFPKYASKHNKLTYNGHHHTYALSLTIRLFI